MDRIRNGLSSPHNAGRTNATDVMGERFTFHPRHTRGTRYASGVIWAAFSFHPRHTRGTHDQPGERRHLPPFIPA